MKKIILLAIPVIILSSCSAKLHKKTASISVFSALNMIYTITDDSIYTEDVTDPFLWRNEFSNKEEFIYYVTRRDYEISRVLSEEKLNLDTIFIDGLDLVKADFFPVYKYGEDYHLTDSSFFAEKILIGFLQNEKNFGWIYNRKEEKEIEY